MYVGIRPRMLRRDISSLIYGGGGVSGGGKVKVAGRGGGDTGGGDETHHFVAAVPLVEGVEVRVRPGVAGDLVAGAVHSPDYLVPAVAGVVDGAFAFVDSAAPEDQDGSTYRGIRSRGGGGGGVGYLRDEKGCFDAEFVENVEEFAGEAGCCDCQACS